MSPRRARRIRQSGAQPYLEETADAAIERVGAAIRMAALKRYPFQRLHFVSAQNRRASIEAETIFCSATCERLSFAKNNGPKTWSKCRTSSRNSDGSSAFATLNGLAGDNARSC